MTEPYDWDLDFHSRETTPVLPDEPTWPEIPVEWCANDYEEDRVDAREAREADECR